MVTSGSVAFVVLEFSLPPLSVYLPVCVLRPYFTGADIMCPGLTSKGADMPIEIEAGKWDNAMDFAVI
jgi:hypothetical protein